MGFNNKKDWCDTMEENNNQEVVNVEESTQVVENADTAIEPQVIDGFSNATVNVETEVAAQTEFVTADQVGGTPLDQVEGAPLPQKKKKNVTLIIVLVFVVVFGGAMLLMKMGNKGGNGNTNNQQKEEEKIKVDTGTEWGDKYLTYLMTEKPELKTYEISFINVDDTETPEMFVKYIDNSNLESMKLFFIADDGYVYETKYYRDYRLRLIYSLKDKDCVWYLYLTSTKNYGSYTKISKIVDNMAFDADIKATNDALLIEYGKRYYDTDYQPIFYTIKEQSMEDDFRDFVSKYSKYNEEVESLKQKTIDKYKDYVFQEDAKEETDIVGIAGRIYNYGAYCVNIPADPENDIVEHIKVIILHRNGKITVEGIMYEYDIDYDNSRLNFGDGEYLMLQSNGFVYMGRTYTYLEEK